MKRIIIILAMIFTTSSILGRSTPADSIQTALLIVDIQDFYFPGDGPGLVNAQEAAKGSDIHKSVEPIEGEKVITKREVNSFQETDLLDYLRKNNITRLVIIGMQTHMCLEAAVRAGHDYGFQYLQQEDILKLLISKHFKKILITI